MVRSSRTLVAAGAALALCAAPDARAQVYTPRPAAPAGHRLELSAFTGWQVNGDADAGTAELVVDDAQSFGAAISVAARPGTRAEFVWTYSRARAEIDSFSTPSLSSRPFDVDTNYFQIGGTQTLKRGRVEPFAGATMGAVWYSPEDAPAIGGNVTYQLDDTWRFAFTVGGGANVYLNRSETLALHLHARLLVPVLFTSGAFYVGPGGSAVAVSGGIPAVSGDFGVGLVLAR